MQNTTALKLLSINPCTIDNKTLDLKSGNKNKKIQISSYISFLINFVRNLKTKAVK